MKKFDKLIGLTVKVFNKNGYNIIGELKHIDSEKIIMQQGEAIFLIYKTEISMVLLNAEAFPEDLLDEEMNPNYNKEVRNKEVESKFAENGVINSNQYGSILPNTLIEQQPVLPEENLEFENDFSVSLSGLYNENGLLTRAARKRELDGSRK